MSKRMLESVHFLYEMIYLNLKLLISCEPINKFSIHFANSHMLQYANKLQDWMLYNQDECPWLFLLTFL